MPDVVASRSVHIGRPRPRRDGDLVRDPRRAFVVAAALALPVVALTLAMALDPIRPVVQPIDDVFRRWVLSFPSWARSWGRVMQVIGSGAVMVPLRVVIAGWLAWRRRWWDLAAWLAGWAVADLLTAVAKPAIARPRPPGAEGENLLTSFPSAHAKTAAQFAIGCVMVFTAPWRSRRLPYAAAITWIVLMSLSRTVIDDHYLSDVIGGCLLGAGAMLAVAGLTQRMRDRRLGPTSLESV